MSLKVEVNLPRRHFTLDLAFEMEKETLGVFGHSGAGKTSLFSLINGLEQPMSGRIELNGRVLTDTTRNIHLPPQKRRIGTVFQEKLLFPHMTVEENLLFGVPYSRNKRIHFQEALELLDLKNLQSSYPSEISGGEQQRTAIGRALMTSPELLLMDEPFNAVDSSLRSNILPYLRRLRYELHIPMLIISHDLPDIQRLTDKILILQKGKCSGYGTIQELLEQTDLEEPLSEAVNTLQVQSITAVGQSLYACDIQGLKHPVLSPHRITPPCSLVLSPDDIVLSQQKIPGISVQNQLSGTITGLSKQARFTYCHIEAGITLLSRITHQAAEEMKLHKGMEITCLFKAHSLKL